ncbi:MAG: elongation factor G [Gemmataceae bacterium]|nr:elongation factor G [Gemmataceae bacterium]
MSATDITKLRNIGIIAHIDAGKTTTTDHILYYSGAKHKLGTVDAGTTDTDYDPEEQERGITIYSACVPFKWRDCTVNLIDTPGHVDFTAEVERSLRVLDGAVCVFDAQKGVEAQSETVWRQADRYAVPRMVFVNKMDVVGANFANVVEEVKERLEGTPAPLTIPIGAGSIKDSHAPFRGIIDLLEMKALFYDPKTEGKTFREEPIPEDQEEEVRKWRDVLFEVLTKNDDKDRITSAYLEGQDIPVETMRQVIREQTLAKLIQPVLAGSGREHIGVQRLMDAVTYYLPSPLDRPPVVGRHPMKKDKEEKRKPDPKEPFSALVFKIVADKHGDLYFLRIYSGTLKANSRPWNPMRNAKEFASKIYHIHADPSNREDLPAAYAGDIVGIIGPKDSITGDTLCDNGDPIVLEQIQFAEAVVSMSIEPESSGDKDKLTDALNRLKREDPTFTWRVDGDTGQTLMNGMGILHLDVKKHRLERDFRLKVRVSKPRVSYRETMLNPVRSMGECIRQNPGSGAGLFAKVEASFSPDPTLAPVSVETDFGEADFPPLFIHAAKEGVLGALQSGELGYPVIGVKAKITFLELDDSLSNEVAFAAAGADAVHRALKNNMQLLEPMMRCEVVISEDYLGPVTADLNARRAEIREVMARGKLRVVESVVALRRMFDYSDKVRSLTQGRASWTMEPQSYGPVPQDVLQALLNPDGSF